MAIVALSFVAAWIGVWLAWLGATRMGWLDRPNSRSFHDQPTPRMGGVGIVLGTLTGLLFLSVTAPIPLFLVALSVGLVSWLDDFRELPRWLRFGVHGLAAIGFLLIFPSWAEVSLPLLGHLAPVVAAPILFVWVAGLINAYNFMDGTDGIAGFQGFIAAGGWALFFGLEHPSGIGIFFLCVAFACAGFLFWNRPRARIFMGDIGSTFLGTLFAGVPFLAVTLGSGGRMAFEAGFLFVWPFVLDTSQTFLWRAFNREAVFEAHRSHVFQRLAATCEHRESGHWLVAGLYGLMALLGAGLHFTEGPFWGKLGVLLGIWVAIVGWTWLRERNGQEVAVNS